MSDNHNDTERAAFEAKYAGSNLNLARSGDIYGHYVTHMAWDAWQARAAIAQQPAKPDDADKRLLRQVFALCEDTEDKCAGSEDQFKRGRAFEAKGISRAIGTWYQDTFCGRSFMGEPVGAAIAQPAEPVAPRDREADRARFTDPAFNRWLDEGISDAGHTVWDAVGDVQAAWSGWDNRQHYAAPTARQPLTEERIVMDGLMMLPTADAKDCAKSFEAGVRFAERAHGITQEGE